MKNAGDITKIIEMILGVLPNADIQTDNHGQIIVYTGLYEDIAPSDPDYSLGTTLEQEDSL